MKLIRRLIGTMLAVSLGLGVQVFGPTLLPYLAKDAVAADLLPALIPSLSLVGYAGDDGFVVTVSNYDPAYFWDLTTTQGGVSFKLPTAVNPFTISVRHLPSSTSAILTVYTSREGYADGTASIIGYSRTPVAAIPVPAATTSPTPIPSPTPTPTPTPPPTPTTSPTPTPAPVPTETPVPAVTTIPNPPTISTPAPPTFDPATDLALSEQRAKDMQQALAEDALETSAEVEALTQRIANAITNQNRAEDRRLMANAKALARLASKTLPNARAQLGRLSLLTAEVRRTLRN